ncbi:transmembrane and immunoglobulin domain-containing protein 2 isoform X2 [Dromaius novaehollandiae]|uniref:transmembrane and immunoglobulin domain-containing protein 2 isoform X2 n=1 Tax=Dromaius novaehollandiae TaxID=8790 RepID=UPI003120484B
MGGPGVPVLLVLLILLTGCLDVSVPMGGTGTAGPTSPPPRGASVSPSPWVTPEDPGAAGPTCPPWDASVSPSPWVTPEDPGAAGPTCPPPQGALVSPSPGAAPGRGGSGGPTPGAAGALRVSQEPRQAWVAPGGGVALGCRVAAAERWQLLRLEWLKAGGDEALCEARLRPAGPAAPAACAPCLRLAWRPPRATLHLRGARPGHAGCYVCRVTLEIPRLATATGNGTLLSVGAAPDDGRGVGLPAALGGGLGGSALLLLALGLCCCRRRCRSADTVIYANTLPRSTRAPKDLVSLKELDNSIYQEGLQRARPPQPPACPGHPGTPGARRARP